MPGDAGGEMCQALPSSTRPDERRTRVPRRAGQRGEAAPEDYAAALCSLCRLCRLCRSCAHRLHALACHHAAPCPQRRRSERRSIAEDHAGGPVPAKCGRSADFEPQSLTFSRCFKICRSHARRIARPLPRAATGAAREAAAMKAQSV